MEAGNIFKGAAIGGAAAGVVNVVLYFIGGALGAEYSFVQPGMTEAAPIPVPMPFIMSLVPALLAGAALVAATKFMPDKAWNIFVGVLVVGFIAMLGGPPMQLGHDMVAVVVLEVMHVVAVAGIYLGVKRFAKD